MKRSKCKMPDGIKIKPDGINDLDPCCYIVREIHRNVTVEISQCVNCGHTSIIWKEQDNTEDLFFSEFEECSEDERNEIQLISYPEDEIGEDNND